MTQKIIIIGAGLAGLAACSRLKEHGFDATIIEARNVAGGRVKTARLGESPIGLGANFIHGIDQNPMTHLANMTNITLVPFNMAQFFHYNHDGNLISNEECDTFYQKMEDILANAKQNALTAETDTSLAEQLAALIKPTHFTDNEADLYLLKHRYFEGYLGADARLLSAKNWDLEEPWPGEHCYLAQSYQPIIDHLQKQCDIRLNTVVTDIIKQEKNIEIKTSQGVFYADKVIVTLPLGVLKKQNVNIQPALPDEKQKAIKKIGMGLLNSLILQFPASFWPAEAELLIYSQFDALSVSSFFNVERYAGHPILLGLFGGERARHIETLTDEQILDKTMSNFRSLYGSTLPDPSGYSISRWHHDPFSRGAYSYPAIGVTAADYDALAAPVDHWLYFAGEATSARFFATTHGAYLSGIREAERIINNAIP